MRCPLLSARWGFACLSWEGLLLEKECGDGSWTGAALGVPHAESGFIQQSQKRAVASTATRGSSIHDTEPGRCTGRRDSVLFSQRVPRVRARRSLAAWRIMRFLTTIGGIASLGLAILLCLPLGYLAHQEISLEPMAAS